MIDERTGIVDEHGLQFGSENPLYQARIVADPSLTADRKLTLPDKDGTLATLSDVGGSTWDYELTTESDVVGVSGTNVDIPDFNLVLPYGLYYFEFAGLLTSATGFSNCDIDNHDGAEGTAYPYTTAESHSTYDNGRAPDNYNLTGFSKPSIMGFGVTDVAARELDQSTRGVWNHFNWGSYYGQNLRLQINDGGNNVTLKAGATLKLRLLRTHLIESWT